MLKAPAFIDFGAARKAKVSGMLIKLPATKEKIFC
jgi:hypothetical protein